ncbi:MAG: redoxin domain-containing protein [Bryobacteraceae bacterium]|jgi:peroxiredoxin
MGRFDLAWLGGWLVVASMLSAASAPTLALRDTNGNLHQPAEWAGAQIAVLFFVTIDCPVANSYVPEMNRLHDRFSPRGVRFYAVQADVTVAENEVARYARDYRYSFPLLLDPRQQLVDFTGAGITPEVAVLAPGGRLAYLGRIDDRVVNFGSQRYQATRHDLADALEAVLAGKPVAHPTTRSIGCAINRLHTATK